MQKRLREILDFLEYVSTNQDEMSYKVEVYSDGKNHLRTKYLKREELYALCEKDGSGNGELMTSRRRDEIVEQAKRDLENLKERVNGCYMINLNKGPFLIACNAEFIVNKEKRTVVALLRPFRTRIVIVRGVAKCDPNDCFNSHIGKAIALRRALGLPVPDEYLNAPQPTEVRVGDVVEMQFESFFTKKLVTDKINPINVCETTIESAAKYFAEGMAKIIDDSARRLRNE